MLNIRILGITSDRKGLILKNNGHNIAFGGHEVQWIVTDDTKGIQRIEAITHNPISGSTNVFPSGYPRERDPMKKVWYATVKDVASEHVYVYTIKWVRDDGKEFDFDPIISIKPSTKIFKKLITLVGASLTILALKFLWKKKK